MTTNAFRANLARRKQQGKHTAAQVAALRTTQPNATWKQIADQAGISTAAARTAWQRHLDSLTDDRTVQAVRAEADGHYRQLLDAALGRAGDGDLAAVEVAARLVDRLVRLWGADRVVAQGSAAGVVDAAAVAARLVEAGGQVALRQVVELVAGPVADAGGVFVDLDDE